MAETSRTLRDELHSLRIDRKTLSHVRFQQFREKADPENWFARNSFSTSKPRHSVFR